MGMMQLEPLVHLIIRLDDMESITGVAKLEAELVAMNSSYVEGFAPLVWIM